MHHSPSSLNSCLFRRNSGNWNKVGHPPQNSNHCNSFKADNHSAEVLQRPRTEIPLQTVRRAVRLRSGGGRRVQCAVCFPHVPQNAHRKESLESVPQNYLPTRNGSQLARQRFSGPEQILDLVDPPREEIMQKSGVEFVSLPDKDQTIQTSVLWGDSIIVQNLLPNSSNKMFRLLFQHSLPDPSGRFDKPRVWDSGPPVDPCGVVEVEPSGQHIQT